MTGPLGQDEMSSECSGGAAVCSLILRPTVQGLAEGVGVAGEFLHSRGINFLSQ